MDINNLNKSQFLLLIFLVMFVTSITTAIVTVTLLDQSPQAAITQTINRVVEKTIETVVPGATTTIIRVKEVPVVVKETDLMVQAVEKVYPSVFRLLVREGEGWKEAGAAFAVRADGLVVTSAQNLPEKDEKEASLAIIGPYGTSSWPVILLSRDNDTEVAVLKMSSTSTLPVLSVTPLSSEDLVFGQTVVSLGRSEAGTPEIGQGIVLGILPSSATSSAELIRTNAVTPETVGGPLVNTKGEISGLSLSRGYAVSVSAIKFLIDQIR